LITNRKYIKWHTQTITNITLAMGTLLIIINPMLITMVTLISIVSLVFRVMPLFSTKDCRFFLYRLVCMNQSCKRWELLAKQNTVTKKNGTVGSIGNTTPILPNTRQIQPTIKYNTRFIVFPF
jgi:hypothetical protein